jgi:hypothetical protein
MRLVHQSLNTAKRLALVAAAAGLAVALLASAVLVLEAADDRAAPATARATAL